MMDGRLCETEFEEGKPDNVLDIGTGTGIWALDFGEHHPQAKVVGVDLMPIQPSWTYPNVQFQVDDLEKEWTFAPNSFDFIHSRHVSLGIKNWPNLLKEVYNHLTPGGVYEISDHSLDTLHCDDDTVTPETALLQYYQLFKKSLQASGVKTGIGKDDYVQMLKDAGFVDIEVTEYKVPWGTWPKNKKLKLYGAWAWENLKTGLEAYGMFLITTFGGKTEEETRKMIADVLAEIEGKKVHGYHLQWQIRGRKPKDSESET